MVLSAAAACTLGAPAAPAQSIDVALGDCASGVRLTARQAPLSEVLRRLALALGFELRFAAGADPVISTDVTAPPLELVQRLRFMENAIVVVAPDPRCPGRARVTAVWVLGRGTGSAPMPPLRTATQIEQERRSRELTETYLRAHGMDPALAGNQ